MSFYSQVPNKRISIIKGYPEYFPVVVKEYHVTVVLSREWVEKNFLHNWLFPKVYASSKGPNEP